MDCYFRIKKRINDNVSYIKKCIKYIDTFHNSYLEDDCLENIHLNNYLIDDIKEEFKPKMQEQTVQLEANNISSQLEANNISSQLEANNISSLNINDYSTDVSLYTNNITTLRQRLKNIKSDELSIEDKSSPDQDYNNNDIYDNKRERAIIDSYEDDDKSNDKSDNFKNTNSNVDNDNDIKHNTNQLNNKQQRKHGRYHSQIFIDDLYDDADEMIYQTVQLIRRYNYCGKIQNLIYGLRDSIKPNAIRLIMCLVWLYSWALFQFAKATEYFFRNIIRFPDELFSCVDMLCSLPKNTNDKHVHVISAFNETGEITSRFKLFLWKYWNTSREVHDDNGFDINTFVKLFNCTMLYCTYLLKDPSNIDQEYEQQVKRVLITKQEPKGKFQRFTKTELRFESVSSVETQKSHDIIKDEYLHNIIMDGASNELKSKETNLLFSHCTFE